MNKKLFAVCVSVLTSTIATVSWAQSPTPTATPFIPRAKNIWSGAYHNCFVGTNGALFCWGSNSNGQIGNGKLVDSLTPSAVVGVGSSVYDVDLGTKHSCSVQINAGSSKPIAKCWGDNSYGQLGDGTTTRKLMATQVAGFSSPDSTIKLTQSTITAGSSHTCITKINTSKSMEGVQCWGANETGQLGTGSYTNSLNAVDVKIKGTSFSGVYAGAAHSCASVVTAAQTGQLANQLECWGNNELGQLGNGTRTTSLLPAQVSGLTTGFTQLTTGLGFHTCVVDNSQLKCWGSNSDGQLGVPVSSLLHSTTPIAVAGLQEAVKQVAVGSRHTCVLTSAGAVKCWGGNFNGQLGNGTTTNSSTPVQVAGITSNAVAISVGLTHSCALLKNSTIKCWGNNSMGQLGDNTRTNRLAPVSVRY